MKQCPKCSRTYANDKQKFCTKDGTALVDAQSAAPHDETVRIDSAQLDDEVTKYISRDLPSAEGGVFDPYKTTVSAQPEKTAPPPAPSQPISPPPAAVPPPSLPAAGPVSAPPVEPEAAPSAFDPFKTTMSASPDTVTGPADPNQSVAQPGAGAASTPPSSTSSVPQVAPPAPPAPPPVTISAPPQPAPPQPAPPQPAPPQPAPSATASDARAAATIPAMSLETSPAVILPPSTPGAAPAAAVPQGTVAPPKKRSKLPLILGILFILLFLGAGGLAAGYFFVLRPMLEKKRVAVFEPTPEPTPIAVRTSDVAKPTPETPKVEVPPYSPPADAVEFVNSSAKLDGKLAEHYVDFSFYYPKSWQKDPKAGVAGASNFAKVERRLPPDFTQENFAVGWYSSSGTAEGDRALFPTLAQNLSAQFAKSFGTYKKVSEGPTKAGAYDGYEFRFESASKNTEHGDIKIWGRVVFLPPPDGGNSGVTLLMLTTSLAPELRSVDDVGVRGELPMMLESFRFGK